MAVLLILASLIIIVLYLLSFLVKSDILQNVKNLIEHIFYYRFQWYILAWKIKSAPSLPIFGHYLSIIKSGNVLGFLNREIWSNNPSPTLVWIGPVVNLLIGDAETAHAILNSPKFIHKNLIYHFIGKCIGKYSMVALPYDIWKVHRKLFDPSVNSLKNMQGFIPNIITAADNINIEFDKLVGDNEVEIHKIILHIISNGTMQNVMGLEFDFYNNAEHSFILESILRLQKLAMDRAFNIFSYPDFLFKYSKNYDEVTKLNQDFDNILYGNFDNYKKRNFNTIMDSGLTFYKNDQISKCELRDEMGTLFVASTETTAGLVYGAIMCLAIYPDYQEKLFKELVAAYPSIDESINQDNFPSFVYLDMVINETMRLLPPIPLIGRQATDNFYLNNNIKIPKGVQVLIDIHKIHRNEKDWGPKSNEFNPENFSRKNVEKRHPTAFLPFSKGPRNCIGSKYGKASARLTLAKIFRKFQFKTSTKLEDVVVEADIVGRLKYYPKIQIIKRTF